MAAPARVTALILARPSHGSRPHVRHTRKEKMARTPNKLHRTTKNVLSCGGRGRMGARPRRDRQGQTKKRQGQKFTGKDKQHEQGQHNILARTTNWLHRTKRLDWILVWGSFRSRTGMGIFLIGDKYGNPLDRGIVWVLF